MHPNAVALPDSQDSCWTSREPTNKSIAVEVGWRFHTWILPMLSQFSILFQIIWKIIYGKHTHTHTHKHGDRELFFVIVAVAARTRHVINCWSRCSTMFFISNFAFDQLKFEHFWHSRCVFATFWNIWNNTRINFRQNLWFCLTINCHTEQFIE